MNTNTIANARANPMANAEPYLTRAGDRLDTICASYYGDGMLADRVAAVLDTNPGLAAKGAVYEAGITIHLPPKAGSSARTTVGLWA